MREKRRNRGQRTRGQQQRGASGLLAIVVVLLLAAGCGEIPPTLPAQEPTAVVEQPSEPLPPTITPHSYPPPSPPPTPSRVPRPTETVGPTPIVLGAEWAPEAERQVYVSSTVVVAPVGDGLGEVGFIPPPGGEGLPIWAQHFTVDLHGNIYILDEVNHRVVRFDPQGRFLANTVYGDAVQGPGDLAVDTDGRVYIYEAAAYGPTPEEAVPRVKLFDPDGKLLWEVPVPSWFIDRHILAMRVDEQGTLWVEGEGYSPNAPIIEGQPYPVIAVPLGNAAGVLSEERQQAMAVPGHLLPNGKTMIVYTLTANGPAYIYDLQGRPIYEPTVGVSSMDSAGNLYYAPTGIVTKWDPRGRVMASFDTPVGTTLIDDSGTVYCLTMFTMDRQRLDTYRVIRWQQK